MFNNMSAFKSTAEDCRIPILVMLFIPLLLILIFIAGVNAGEMNIGMIVEKQDTATYDETLEGFWQVLWKADKDFSFIKKNAKNNMETVESITKQFADNPAVQLVVILGSKAAQIANRRIKNKPLVFGAVNHPQRLGLAGDNIAGTTYYISPSTVVNLILKIKPEVEKVGIVYEPPEQNGASIVEVPETRKALQEKGIAYVDESVKVKGEIVKKVKRVVEQGAEFVIIPTNRLLYSNVNLIRSVCDPAKVPVVSFSRRGVSKGAMIAITSNNRMLGQEMAQMVLDIADGNRTPKEIQWYFPNKYTILVNEQTRADLEVQIPKKIYSIATKIRTNPL